MELAVQFIYNYKTAGGNTLQGLKNFNSQS